MRTQTIASLCVVLSVTLGARPAVAQEVTTTPPPASPPSSVAIEAGVGVGLGVPFGGLAVGPQVFLEGGARLLAGPGALSIALRGSYQRFAKDGTGSLPCPAVGAACIQPDGGAYSFHLDEQALLIGVPITYRFFAPDQAFTPYAGVLPEVFLLGTKTTSFGLSNTQGDVRFGVAVLLGGQYRVGPGSLFLDLAFQYAGLGAKDPTSGLSLTGASNLGAFTAAVGYRMGFGG